jgi:hypothetical protein
MNFEKFQYLFVFFEFGKTRFEPLQFELFFKNRINWKTALFLWALPFSFSRPAHILQRGPCTPVPLPDRTTLASATIRAPRGRLLPPPAPGPLSTAPGAPRGQAPLLLFFSGADRSAHAAPSYSLSFLPSSSSFQSKLELNHRWSARYAEPPEAVQSTHSEAPARALHHFPHFLLSPGHTTAMAAPELDAQTGLSRAHRRYSFSQTPFFVSPRAGARRWRLSELDSRHVLPDHPELEATVFRIWAPSVAPPRSKLRVCRHPAAGPSRQPRPQAAAAGATFPDAVCRATPSARSRRLSQAPPPRLLFAPAAFPAGEVPPPSLLPLGALSSGLSQATPAAMRAPWFSLMWIMASIWFFFFLFSQDGPARLHGLLAGLWSVQPW